MKVILLGKTGMLGSCFLSHLGGSEDFEMYAYGHDDLDITDSAKMSDVLKRIGPDFVINCTAYTAVDDCESNRDMAFKVNADAVGEIAGACRELGAVLLHFSTDYVFDGEKSDGYREDDMPSPINVYGESKLEGERIIARNMKNFYIIRTSWLFGDNGRNFVNTMIELAANREELNVVGDQTGSPTYTSDLCEAVIGRFFKPFLSNLPRHHEHNFEKKPSTAGATEFRTRLPFGIYHLTNYGTCSWYDFAKKIFELQKIKIKVNKVTSEAFVRAARRPRCSILVNTKTEPLRPWEEALRAYLGLNF